MGCKRFLPKPISRRQMLLNSANGFGALAFQALAYGETAKSLNQGETHFPAKAKKCDLPVHGWRAFAGGYF